MSSEPLDDAAPEYERRRLTITWDEYMAERAPLVQSLYGDGLIVKGGGYLIVSGDTGVGKTILVSNLLIAAAEGKESFLGFALPGRPVTSLILEAEGSRYRFRDRIQQIARALGAEGNLPIHFHAADTELAIEGPTLEAMIAETGAEIVFMDTIGRFWSGDEYKASEWRTGVTVPLAKIAAAHNTAFAFGDHYNKPPLKAPAEDRGQHKTRGTPAKVQDCGAAMRLEYGKGGKASRVLYFDRVKDGPLPFSEQDPPREPSQVPLLIDVRAGTVQLDEAQDADLGPTIEPRLLDVRRLLESVSSSSLGKASTAALRLKIESELGLEKSRASDLIASAVRANVIERAGHGYYQLPGSLLDAQ